MENNPKFHIKGQESIEDKANKYYRHFGLLVNILNLPKDQIQTLLDIHNYFCESSINQNDHTRK
jgi:hypothetical protein